MTTKTKLPPPVILSKDLSAYRLTKGHQAVLQRWKDMRAYMKLANREPQNIRLKKADYADINAAVINQSEGKRCLADLRFEGVPILSAEVSAQMDLMS